MSTIHFLNVKEGDCSVIQHNSDRVSVIDVCNAKPDDSRESQSAKLAWALRLQSRGVRGNFRQKEHPVNPIEYLKGFGISSVFRFILTHPDMDHMDGIKAFFEELSPGNFCDTANEKEMESSSWSGSPYNQADWNFYKNLRDSNPQSDPKRLTKLSGDIGQYWNRGEGESPSG